MQDITWVAELIITILAIVLARFVIPCIKAKTIAANNDELDYWVHVAVCAMEERYKNIESSGGLKLDDAISFLQSKGYTLDEEQLSAVIDAKVRELFNWGDYEGI